MKLHFIRVTPFNTIFKIIHDIMLDVVYAAIFSVNCSIISIQI